MSGNFVGDVYTEFDEVERRLNPALTLIDRDEKLYQAVVEISMTAPDYFWERPGAYKGYHNAFKHGLWFHTLKVAQVVYELGPTYVESGVLSEHDILEGIAAAILHDQRKNGTDPDSETTSIDHARIMSQVIEQHGVLADDVVRSVRQHMGPWGEERPDAPLSQLVHLADMFASRDTMTIKLNPLIPKELTPYASWDYKDTLPNVPKNEE
jgi:hypothetical protein